MEILGTLKEYLDDLRKRLILKNYYSKKEKDGKNLGASFFDWLLISVFAAGFFLVTSYKVAKNLLIALLISISLMIIYLFLIINIGLRRRAKSIVKINEELAKEEVANRLEKLNNREYLLYIQDVLEEYYQTQLRVGVAYIDYLAKINGRNYGIKCFKTSLENIIIEKDIENFYESMEEEAIDNGIVITNGYIHEELQKDFDYIFIDFNYLRKILKDIGRYPNSEEIRQLILMEHRAQKQAIKEELKNNSGEKVHRFGILGFILFVIATYTDYPLYYRISGLLLIVVSLLLGLRKLVVLFKSRQEN